MSKIHGRFNVGLGSLGMVAALAALGGCSSEFGDCRDISDPQVLSPILTDLGLDAEAVLAEALTDCNKMRLRRMGEEVLSRGIFGAPTFFTEDGEMFWGNDRLEQALEWALAQARRSDWPV